MKRLFYWIPAMLWAAFAFYLSSQPRLPDFGPQFHNKDKILHFGFYLVFWFLALLPLRYGHRFSLPVAIIVAFLVTASYGASDEFHQRYVPGRTCDVADWAADTFGGFIAASAYWVYEKHRSKKAHR